MGEFFTWLTSNPWGVGALVVGLIALFVLFALISERRIRRLYPDQDRRGTRAVARAKAKKAAAKSAAAGAADAAGAGGGAKGAGGGVKGAKGTGSVKKAASASSSDASKPKAAPKKGSTAQSDEDAEENLSLEGFFTALWGDEESGQKGLIESLWESDDDDEAEQ
ncbi:MAG: hypothetical protein LBO07_01100 [Coriobacteriales bacterium]|jgi:hypothetical protein|nr:hypothetical protein [Coriobacteriales bacterium]